VDGDAAPEADGGEDSGAGGIGQGVANGHQEIRAGTGHGQQMGEGDRSDQGQGLHSGGEI
jgi:hypothetical protein